MSSEMSEAAKYRGQLVKFELRSGTTKKLVEIGRHDGTSYMEKKYPGMCAADRGWNERYVRFKYENEVENIAFGKGGGCGIV